MQHLAFAQGHIVEHLRGHPGIEAFDRQSELPIGLQQAERQRAGTHRIAGLRHVAEFAGIELGNVRASDGTDLEATVGHHDHRSRFTRGLAQSDAWQAPGGLRVWWRPGQESANSCRPIVRPLR